jgi:hypothetical protein
MILNDQTKAFHMSSITGKQNGVPILRHRGSKLIWKSFAFIKPLVTFLSLITSQTSPTTKKEAVSQH